MCVCVCVWYWLSLNNTTCATTLNYNAIYILSESGVGKWWRLSLNITTYLSLHISHSLQATVSLSLSLSLSLALSLSLSLARSLARSLSHPLSFPPQSPTDITITSSPLVVAALALVSCDAADAGRHLVLFYLHFLGPILYLISDL